MQWNDQQFVEFNYTVKKFCKSIKLFSRELGVFHVMVTSNINVIDSVTCIFSVNVI